MIEKLGKMNHKLEKALYERGFRESNVRALVRNQVYIAAAAAIFGLVLFWAGTWPLFFALGTLLISYNFYSLSKFIQHVVYYKFSKKLLISLLLRLYGRLLFTGLAMVLLIGWLDAPVVPLLAGLSTVVFAILVWGGAQIFEHNVKEA